MGSDETSYGFKLNFPADCWGATDSISLVAFTPTTGTASGASTDLSLSVVGPNTYTVITDSGQSWTTNNLAGKFVSLTHNGATRWYGITSNTSTTITTTCNQNAITDGFSAGDTYEIRTLTGSNTVLMYAGTTSGNNFTDISIKHTSFDGSSCGVAYRTMNNIGLKSTAYTGKTITNINIDHNYFGDTNTNIVNTKWETGIVSNNYFGSNYSGCGNEVHGQQISLSGNNMSFYNNIFKNSTIGAFLVHLDANSNGAVYNNIFVQSPAYATAAPGLIQADYSRTDCMKNWNVHNNSVIGAITTALGFLLVGNISDLSYKTIAYNNLFYNNGSPKMNNAGYTANAIDHQYNAHYNSSGTYDSSEGGTAQVETGNPFINSGAEDYHLISTSPSIDAGTSIGLTADFDGNPIYGTPDIGAYEYQPRKDMLLAGSSPDDSIGIGTTVRVYGDGKFRDVGTTNPSTAYLKILGAGETFPSYGTGQTIPQWMDISIGTWDNTGNHHKAWTESSTVSGLTNTVHTVGDLEASKYYNVTVDNGTSNLDGNNCSTVGSSFVCQANNEGKIEFSYTGTYSDHTFDVTEGDNTGPTTTATPAGGTYTTAQSVTLTCDDDSGVGCDKTYYTLDGTDPTTSSTEYCSSLTISSNTTLKFFSTDLNGESESIRTETYTISPSEDDRDDDLKRDLDIHGIKSSSTASTIAIEWKTDYNAKSTIRYGTDRNLKEIKKDDDKEKKHKVTLTSLLPDTLYYFRIKSEGGDDNEDRSKIHSIRTKSQSKSNQDSFSKPQGSENIQTSRPSYSGNPTPKTCSYTVEAGDTLWQIAQEVYGDPAAYPLIIEKNKARYPNIASVLIIGQELSFGCENETETEAVQGASDTKNYDDDYSPAPSSDEIKTQESTFKWWNPFSWF